MKPSKKPEHISFANSLDQWARARFNIDPSVKELSHVNHSGNLDLRHGEVRDLYLRLWPETFKGDGVEIGYWPPSTFVIARIEFATTRAGHGRALLQFLVKQAAIYGFENIALESTYDGEEIQGFAKKYGFQHAWPHDTAPQRNWIATVSRIAKHVN
jgi:hypothetical protein